jgi:hypothetical protein
MPSWEGTGNSRKDARGLLGQVFQESEDQRVEMQGMASWQLMMELLQLFK